MEIEPLVDELRRDDSSRSDQLVQQGAKILVAFAGGWPATTPEELQEGLVTAGRQLYAARPALAPLFHMVTELYALAGEPGDVAMTRRAIRAAAVDFTQTLEAREDKVARQAADLLGGAGRVMTIGGHESVERALLIAAADGALAGVRIGEGRPRYSGRGLAAKLAGAGALDVEVVTDRALPSCLAEVDIVLIGADAVLANGVVATTGSGALATVARAEGKPVHAIAGILKLLPPAENLPDLCEPGSAADVWDAAPEGVAVANPLREIVPLKALSGIVTEGGPSSPYDMEKRIRAMPVPPWIGD